MTDMEIEALRREQEISQLERRIAFARWIDFNRIV